jgi:hypothetical protein
MTTDNSVPQPDHFAELLGRLLLQETRGEGTIQPLSVQIARDALEAGLVIGRQVIHSEKLSIANVIELARMVYQIDANLRSDEDDATPGYQPPPGYQQPQEPPETMTMPMPPKLGGNP